MHIKHPWLLFFGLTMGPFMVGIDLLAIGVAIEPMTKALSIDIATLQWFLSAFAIGNSSFLVTAGRIADLYGRKIVLMAGLTIFALSSAVIAATSSPHLIIVARLIQGASGGILPVVGISVFVSAYPPDKRTGWISGLVGMVGLGMVLGPAIGGLLIHYFSWRLVFLINLPVALFGILLLHFFLPKTKPNAAPGEKIDWIGVVLFTGLLISFTIAVSQGHYWGWTSAKTIGTFAITLLLLLSFLYAQKKVSMPLIEFDLFRVRNFTSGGLLGFTLYFSLVAWILIFGIYLEKVMGMTAWQAGFSFLPFGVVLASVSTMMNKMTKRFGPKNLIISGNLFGTIAFIGMALIPTFPRWEILYIWFALFGLCFILVNSNTIPAALEYMPVAKSGIASGKAFMFRWLGGALGAAIISSIFMTHSSNEMYRLATKDPVMASQQTLLHDVITGQQMPEVLKSTFSNHLPQVQNAVDHAYHHGLMISMFVIAGLFLLSLLLSIFGLKERETSS